MRWWQFGLFGGGILWCATAVKVVRAIVRGAAGNTEWGEAANLSAAIFGMGFLCGVIVWAGRGLYRRLGMAGDAIVGLAVMVAFFIACMLLFEPAMLGSKFWSGAVPMLGMAVVLGLIGGAWIGRDIRRELSPPGGVSPARQEAKVQGQSVRVVAEAPNQALRQTTGARRLSQVFTLLSPLRPLLSLILMQISSWVAWARG